MPLTTFSPRNLMVTPRRKFDCELFCMDCIDFLSAQDRDSIDLVVTSPPYDNIRNYENTLVWERSVWEEVIHLLYPVMKPGGVVVWIVNDETINGSETGTSFAQALYAKEVGFNLHDTMIWNKGGFTSPETNRYPSVFEYMFIWSKGKPKTFNRIEDRKNKYPTGSIRGTHRNREGQSNKTTTYAKQRREYGTRFNIWEISSVNKKMYGDHPSVFPIFLAKDHIKTWSNTGDLVLDPFMGSGTVGIACKHLGRRFIGVDCVKEYVEIAQHRISTE